MLDISYDRLYIFCLQGPAQSTSDSNGLAEAVMEVTERMVEEQEAAVQVVGGGEGTVYEFLPQEEQLLELLMNSMRVAGLALAVEALSTLLLGR